VEIFRQFYLRSEFNRESKDFESSTGLELGMRINSGRLTPGSQLKGWKRCCPDEQEVPRFQAWNREPRQLERNCPVHISNPCMLHVNVAYRKGKVNYKKSVKRESLLRSGGPPPLATQRQRLTTTLTGNHPYLLKFSKRSKPEVFDNHYFRRGLRRWRM
jgi:hypothetical protein